MIVTMMNSVKGFPMNAKKNLGTKIKINFQEEALHLEKRKIKLTEERLMKKYQADEDYMFLMSLLPSIKKNWTTLKDWNSEWNF